MSTLTCPDRETLSRLMIGLLPRETAELHQQHLEHCAACVETVEQLAAEDTLTQSLAGGHLCHSGASGDIEELIDRIRRLPFGGANGSDLDLDVAQFLKPPEQDDELGRLGDHRVLRCLGSGGMGIVFKAEDTRLQRTVALKVMHPVLAASRNAGKRFLREARAAAAFEHEHVVTIYNVGEDRGLPWLSMQLLEGESLETRLRAAAPLPVEETLRIGREAAAGLAAAHERGLLHRDIKPDNIWLEAKGDHVTIVDFGLARVSEGDSLVTREGAILGTPEYMSPEQARGEAIDVRSDLFSLGCVLYRMTTGVSPFARGNLIATLGAVSLETVAAPCELSPDVLRPLSELIMRLLAKSPDDRPASAEEVGAALQAIAEGDVDSPPAAARRRKTTWPLLIALALGAVVGFAAASVIHWTTDKGTLVVETADDKIAVTVAEGSLLLRDRDSGEEVSLRVGENRLPSGEYELLLHRDDDGLALSVNQFALVRGGKQRVRVYWKKPGKTDADKAPIDAMGDVALSKPPKWLPQDDGLSLPEPGEPLSPQALVQQPAPLPGVASWSVETRGHRASVSAAALSPDGKLLATSGYDGAIRLWNGDDHSLKQVLLGLDGAASALEFSPDGGYLAAAGNEANDTVLRIWELGETTRLVRRRLLPRHVRRLAWSPPEGALIALQDRESEPPTLFAWRDNRMLSNFGVSGAVSERPWSHNGRLLATADGQGVHLWDVEARQAVHTIPGEDLSDAQWSGEGPYLAVLHRFRLATGEPYSKDRWKIEIWNVDDLQLADTLDLGTQELHTSARRIDYSWSPDGTHVASWRTQETPTGSYYDVADETQLWDVLSGEATRIPQLSEGGSGSAYSYLPRSGHQGFAWSADGKKLSTVYHGRAWITDVDSTATRAAAGFNDQLSLQLSSLAPQRIASLRYRPGETRSLNVFDLDPMQLHTIGRWKPDEGFLYSVSPSGDTIATLRVAASRTVPASPRPGAPFDRGERTTQEIDWEIKFWNASSGELNGETKLTSVSTSPQLIWSPGSDRLALVDAKVRILDPGKAAVVRTMEDSAGPMVLPRPFVWSPDGRAVLTYDAASIVLADAASEETPVQRLTAPPPDGFRASPSGIGRRRRADDSLPEDDGDWEAVSLAWSRDGTRVAAIDVGRFVPASLEGFGGGARPNWLRIHVWERQAGDYVMIRTIDDESQPEAFRSRSAFNYRTALLAFSPDGQTLAYRSGNVESAATIHAVAAEHLKLFDLESKDSEETSREIPVELVSDVNSLDWIDDHRLLLTAGEGASKYAVEYALVDTRTGETLAHRRGADVGSVAVDRNSVAVVEGAQYELADVDGPPRAALVHTGGDDDRSWAAVSPRGYFKLINSGDGDLVYTVLMADGEQLTLTPEEFAKRFGWKNQPQQVRLSP